ILGILTAVAIPSYTNYVMRADRAEAQRVLEEANQRIATFFSVNMTYQGITAAPASAPGLNIYEPNGAFLESYTLAINITNNSFSYTLTATPLAGTKQENDSCGILSIDQDGVHLATRSGSPVANCW
ncbi:MAG: hypothetical protein GY822_19590, partial [Deltaproteobacteria bacterium]|nr:hypothetical protein [Deltaproteobacteria bacterium]